MFEWLVILYILFIFISAILDATKKAKDQKEIIIKKIERTKERLHLKNYLKKWSFHKKQLNKRRK